MNIKAIATAAALLACATPSFAVPVTFTFEGINSFDSVGNYYNGGAGPNLHTSFAPDALALANDGTGDGPNGEFFLNAPGPGGTIVFPATGDIFMTAAPGWNFLGSLSFNYSAIQAFSVAVLDGSNSLLATKTFSANNGSCGPPAFCNWSLGLLDFSGYGKTIRFGGYDALNGSIAAFDNITTTVPAPATAWLMAPALAMLARVRMRRKRLL
ncbi:MAG: hypothetical protein ABIQ86_09780 [Steroidobacteraceae bacterium]